MRPLRLCGDQIQAMPKKAEKITPDDLPRLIESLAGEDVAEQQHALRLLCPCRNRVYDQDVWKEIYRALESPQGHEVRDRAKHAVETLEQRALVNEDAKELLDDLARQGYTRDRDDGRPPRHGPGGREERINGRSLPQILDQLNGEDPHAQEKALRALCPCRNRVYDSEVWRQIFAAHHNDPVGAVRDQAWHAIDTLLKRARTDPRSQDLLRRLAAQEVTTHNLEAAIPEWRPRPTDGLPIPRWERSRRSKANRRRR